MNNMLNATTLDDSLAEIVSKLQTLMDSFWIYIVMALAAVVVVWGAYVGIKIAIAHKNEEKYFFASKSEYLQINSPSDGSVTISSPSLYFASRQLL